MKQLLSILFLFLAVSFKLSAQSPEKISYQAIIRARDNSLLINSNVSLKIIIHQGAANGIAVYQENHSVTSNNNGLVSLEIGTGQNVTGTFNTIAWQNGSYFIETQVDIAGGTNYNIVGVTQLLSVPYALHSKTADRLVGSTTTNNSKAAIISFSNSRNVASADINNTIECTTSSTLTLTSGFASMIIGDTINLEAHNGAVLTLIPSSGVTINYNSVNAIFTSSAGKVRFGFLRKSGLNSYIISGQ